MPRGRYRRHGNGVEYRNDDRVIKQSHSSRFSFSYRDLTSSMIARSRASEVHGTNSALQTFSMALALSLKVLQYA
jgi:hypothetical protein